MQLLSFLAQLGAEQPQLLEMTVTERLNVVQTVLLLKMAAAPALQYF